MKPIEQAKKIIKEFTELLAQLDKLLVRMIGIVGWLKILSDLLK